MKKLLTLAVLLLLNGLCFAQTPSTDYTTISYTQLFDKIAAETDTVFRLSDHIIEYNKATDSLFSAKFDQGGSKRISRRKVTLVIDKAIVLDNVHFLRDRSTDGVLGVLTNIRFNKSVSVQSMLQIDFSDCEFMDDLELDASWENTKVWDYFKDYSGLGNPGVSLEQSKLHGNTTLNYNPGLSKFYDNQGDKFEAYTIILNNTFVLDKKNGGVLLRVEVRAIFNSFFWFASNVFKKKAYVSINDSQSALRDITDNDFNSAYLDYRNSGGDGSDQLDFSGNLFQGVTLLYIEEFNPKYNLDYTQFNGSLISVGGYFNYRDSLGILPSGRYAPLKWDQIRDSLTTEYLRGGSSTVLRSFDEEVRLRGMFYNLFKAQFNTSQANAAFIDMKDIETERYKYLYQQSPAFRTFFKWKINQFLKLFVDYGTEPAKAIVMSLYVVLLFAMVYLFFPNHWDSHGKNRLKHRFGFFYKYMSLNAGIQDVYLEENKADIEDNEAFKSLLIAHKAKAPKMFFNLAMPLYRWSVAGTLSYAWLIKRFDFLKGTWQDTEPKVRGLKSFLIGTLFIIALLYDIFIKMLNALMLSINTFTTLGFGEIPIKGLPRYLAIIQGFIGWFMLTIFSVSLISQLLN